MTDTAQNFSVYVGNDTDVLFDIGPDDTGLNLALAQSLTWKAYDQTLGVPEMSTAVISKASGSGIIITDPLLLTITVTLNNADTSGLNGNYYHEIKVVDTAGKVTTTTIGFMTVIDPAAMPNVAAFKAMFPDLASFDDTLVQVAIDHAAQFVDESWGNSQANATMYLAAHFMASAHATADTDGRVVSSETIGRMSISYAVGSASGGGGDGVLAMTRYGLVFKSLLAGQGFGIAIV
jgi:Protein of unknown function (DUF4054)